jgi:hypothetical protein
MAAIERLVRIFATPVPAFFPRENPISSIAKPACISRTKMAAMTTHIVLIGTVSPSLPSIACARSSAVANALAGRTSSAANATSASGPALFRLDLMGASSFMIPGALRPPDRRVSERHTS